MSRYHPQPPGPVCFVRPKRLTPRKFTESDAARIFCQAKYDSGATVEGLLARIEERCPDPDTRNRKEKLAEWAEALALILALILGRNAIGRAALWLAKLFLRRKGDKAFEDWKGQWEDMIRRLKELQDDIEKEISR